jgi:hypothetical protein
MRRSILVEHAQHPNEWPTDESRDIFLKVGGSAIHNTLGNPEGFLGPVDPVTGCKSRNFSGQNIGMCGKGDPRGAPAQQRAHQLIRMHNEYDLGAAIHGVEDPTGACVWYSPRATMLVRSVAALLATKAVVTAPYSPLYYMPNTFGIELVRGADPSLETVCELLVDVANGYTPPWSGIEEYAYVGDVTVEQAHHLGLRSRYASFEPMCETDHEALRTIGYATHGAFYTNGWDAAFDAQSGYRGELLVRYEPDAGPLQHSSLLT